MIVSYMQTDPEDGVFFTNTRDIVGVSEGDGFHWLLMSNQTWISVEKISMEDIREILK